MLLFRHRSKLLSISTRFSANSRVLSSVAPKLHEQTQQLNVVLKIDPLFATLKPKEVVDQLDKYIIGQSEAKRAVAIALRNRWRRHRLGADLKNEVIPKNILMIGPTGCGKTEIARRIAKLVQAPFIKVEATKFTEVGFHGKDVDQIIKDLVDISINMTKKRIREEVTQDLGSLVEERILDALLGSNMDETQRETYRGLLRSGQIEHRTIEIDVPPPKANEKAGVAGFGDNPAMILLGDVMKNGGRVGGRKADRKKLKISEARPLLMDAEVEKVVDSRDVEKEAIAAVEESGIVFIDEIDKLVNGGDYKGADASSEGVQRDLLPLIEGTTITTKHGNVNTDFILFIAAGAFHSSKPSDLLAELQGRLPIRVALKALSEQELYRILTEPVNNMIRLQTEMMKAEDVELTFTNEAIAEIARVACLTNKTVENIGARRLHTVIEKVIEEVSFDAADKAGEKIVITEEYVKKRVGDLMTSADLRKYIL